jgi:hypothetical protein
VVREDFLRAAARTWGDGGAGTHDFCGRHNGVGQGLDSAAN